MKRKISIVIDNRTNWTKAQSICEEVEANPDIELQLILTSTFEQEHRRDPEFLERWMPKRLPLNLTSMVWIASDLMIDLEEFWADHQPDVVVALTDRFETLAVAQTAALMNIYIAHVQGGEMTGTIDESIRHAVTKLSHIHFVSNLDAKQRVIRLGEDPKYIFDVGCPSIDLLLRTDAKRIIEEPYILVLMHPVTTELGSNFLHTISIVKAVLSFSPKLVIFISPNMDEGSIDVTRAYKTINIDHIFQYKTSISPEEFHSLMKHCSVMVGNSSAGIREAGYFGIPVVDCGTRQQFRIRGRNVITISDLSKPDGVKSAIESQLNYGRYEPHQLFGNGTAGKQISDLLSTMELPSIQKHIRF